MRIINFEITEKDDKKQIRTFLREFGVSASLLTKLKHTENGITKNGAFAKTIEELSVGDTLTIKIENSGSIARPMCIDIEIPYEDEDIIVLNKPPLLPVHESRNHIGDTLSNFVAYHCGEDMAFRAVYRLDRDTSGLVLVAKNELAAAKLAGKIKKDYYAVVDGTIENDGVIDAPIARCGDSIIKRKVDENGETAITEYYPVKSNGNATLVKFNLKTGRTHQIRVHMEHIGHSLLGDKLYGGDCSKIDRQALHCKDIYFTHPITENPMHITCDFPNDMKNLV
ncbi:RluA family pseudouridine synthase [Eubacterium sp.]